MELDVPLRAHASFPNADSKIHFTDSTIGAADGANKVPAPINGVVPKMAGLFIDLQTRAVSNASHFVIPWPSSNTVGYYRRIGFFLNHQAKIEAAFTFEKPTLEEVADPGVFFVTGTPICYVEVVCTDSAGSFRTVGSVNNIVENSGIFRFYAGGIDNPNDTALALNEGTATGQTGELVTFAQTFVYNGKVQFFRNGIKMVKVAAFSADFSYASEEYMEVNDGALSYKITLNPLTPAVAKDTFSFYYVG